MTTTHDDNATTWRDVADPAGRNPRRRLGRPRGPASKFRDPLPRLLTCSTPGEVRPARSASVHATPWTSQWPMWTDHIVYQNSGDLWCLILRNKADVISERVPIRVDFR